jgi:hypothetical protein
MLEKVFTFRIDQETYEELVLISKKTKWSKGMVIRILINKFSNIYKDDYKLNKVMVEKGEE